MKYLLLHVSCSARRPLHGNCPAEPSFSADRSALKATPQSLPGGREGGEESQPPGSWPGTGPARCVLGCWSSPVAGVPAVPTNRELPGNHGAGGDRKPSQPPATCFKARRAGDWQRAQLGRDVTQAGAHVSASTPLLPCNPLYCLRLISP